jgi:hypothetical protein
MSDPEKPVSMWKRLSIGAGLFVLLLVLIAFAQHWLQGSRDRDALRRVLAALDESDPSWRLDDLEAARANLPDEQNSALTVLANGRLLPKDAFIHMRFQQLLRTPSPELLDDKALSLLEKELADMHAAVAVARKLADRPAGKYPRDYPRIPIANTREHADITRPVISLLQFDALYLAQKGRPRESLRSCRAMIHAARAFDDEPLASSQFGRIAGVSCAVPAIERTLALSEPAAEDLADLQRLVEDEEKHPGLLLARPAERAMVHEMVEGLLTGAIPVKDLYQTDDPHLRWRVQYAPWSVRATLLREYPAILEVFSKAVEIARLPLHEQDVPEQDLKEIMHQIRRRDHTPLIFRRWAPIPDIVGASYRDHVTRLRCLTVLLALERYRQERNAWPANLAELTPRFLKAVPLDPHDGKELRYRRLADGVIVYSVGPDKIDDGGLIPGMKSGSGTPSRDVGLRLWDVKHRRQPAKSALGK